MKPYILIDSHYICYRALYTTGDFSYGSIETGILYGFIYTLKELALKFSTNRFVFCWDTPIKTNKRKLIYPNYKNQERTKRSEEEAERKAQARIQMAFIRDEFLPSLGFKNVFYKEGYESDDLIAYLVDAYRLDYEWIIITSDNDLYQLLGESVWIYDIARKRRIDRDWLVETWLIEPSKWAWVKAIVGCKSDHVEGISGIAEKTAIRYLNGVLDKKSVAYQKIIDSDKKIKENYKLVALPFSGVGHGIKLARPEQSLNKDYFVETCMRYGFKNLKFEDFFKALNLQ